MRAHKGIMEHKSLLKCYHAFISQTLIKNQLKGVYSIGWIKNTKIDPMWIWNQRIPMQ